MAEQQPGQGESAKNSTGNLFSLEGLPAEFTYAGLTTPRPISVPLFIYYAKVWQCLCCCAPVVVTHKVWHIWRTLLLACSELAERMMIPARQYSRVRLNLNTWEECLRPLLPGSVGSISIKMPSRRRKCYLGDTNCISAADRKSGGQTTFA